jgi:hypothetical protein
MHQPIAGESQVYADRAFEQFHNLEFDRIAAEATAPAH